MLSCVRLQFVVTRFCFPFSDNCIPSFVYSYYCCWHPPLYVFFCFHLYSCDPFNFCFSSFCMVNVTTAVTAWRTHKQILCLFGRKWCQYDKKWNRLLFPSLISVYVYYVSSKYNKMCLKIENETNLRTSSNSSFSLFFLLLPFLSHPMFRQNLMTNRKSILTME